METLAPHDWYLRKHEDGSVFGPLNFVQLAQWAYTAQVAPQDYISGDQATWVKAPMVPELGMDWIVEVTSERFYGPTTLGSIREFLRLEEIDDDTFVINACDGSRQQIRDIALLLEEIAVVEQPAKEAGQGPSTTGMSIAVHDRIRELEQALREERRALAELERHYRDLEAKHNALVNAAAASDS